MKATDVLMQEHRVIERVLAALEIAANHLEQSRPVRPGFFLEATEFIAGYADGCHHRKEEGVLFGAMIESGVPREGGVIAVMLDEHEAGRAYTRALREAARRLERGDADAHRQVVANIRGYVDLLRDHIGKEDEMLFPMADDMLSPPQLDSVLRGFAELERNDLAAGALDRFPALATQLESEARALVV